MEKADTDIQASFDNTLKNSDLSDISQDVAELSIDHFMAEGLLREIPIVKTLVSLAKFGANIRDKLFLKKILAFMVELQDTNAKDRSEVIQRIDASKTYRVKVGEKLLYILDSCNDHESAELVAKMFAALMQGQIEYDDFLASSVILKDISFTDLNWFLEQKESSYDIAEAGSLIGSGLFAVEFQEVEVTVQDQDDYKYIRDGGSKYSTDVSGGEMLAYLTPAGRAIRKVLSIQK